MTFESFFFFFNCVAQCACKACCRRSFILSLFLYTPSISPHSNSPAHKYYLATNPVSGAVYLSDTSSRKVFKVKSLRVVKDVAKNLELVAGTGDQCLPYDDARCGDGGKAVEATLTNPRGWLCLVLIPPPSFIGVKM